MIIETNLLVEKDCDPHINIGRYGTCYDWIIDNGLQVDGLKLRGDKSKDLVIFLSPCIFSLLLLSSYVQSFVIWSF